MKTLKLLALCLCAVLTSWYFVSCDKDDEEVNNSIVGTWDYTEVVDDAYMMFCSDGTGYFFEAKIAEKELGMVNKIEYTYNANTGAISIKECHEDSGTSTGTAIIKGDEMDLKLAASYGEDVVTLYRVTSTVFTRDDLEKAYQEQQKD